MPKNIYIGFDRDGTLEMPGKPTPFKLSQQFKKLENKGVKLFLASGKSHALLKDFAKNIELNTWMICAENGGHIVIPSQNINHIQPDCAHLSTFKSCVGDLGLPSYKEEPKHSIWSKKFGDQVLNAEKIIKQHITYNQWDLEVYSHVDGALDVVPQHINKSNLLPYLPDNTDIYYIGDGQNDLELLSNSRVIPCTIDNAEPIVKETVRKNNGYIASGVAGDGVSELLSKIFSV